MPGEGDGWLSALLCSCPKWEPLSMSKFYFDSRTSVWVRRLLQTSSRKIDLSITPVNGEWDLIKEEKIRIHRTENRGIELVDALPEQIKKDLFKNVGPVLGYRLIGFQYVRVIGIYDLLASERKYNYKDGIPAKELIKL